MCCVIHHTSVISRISDSVQTDLCWDCATQSNLTVKHHSNEQKYTTQSQQSEERTSQFGLRVWIKSFLFSRKHFTKSLNSSVQDSLTTQYVSEHICYSTAAVL